MIAGGVLSVTVMGASAMALGGLAQGAAAPGGMAPGDPVVAWFGVAVHSPASVVTNFALAGQCLWYAVRLWGRQGSAGAGGTAGAQGIGPVPAASSGGWIFFFLGLAAATFLGAFKHGLPWLEPPELYQAVKAGSNLALVVAVVGVQRAVLPRAGAFSLVFALALVMANLASTEFGYTAAVLATGMAPVIGVSVARAVKCRRVTPLLATWGVLAVAGGVWAAGLGFSPWFDHTDVAHLVLMAGFALAARAAMAPLADSSARPPVLALSATRERVVSEAEEPRWT